MTATRIDSCLLARGGESASRHILGPRSRGDCDGEQKPSRVHRKSAQEASRCSETISGSTFAGNFVGLTPGFGRGLRLGPAKE